MERFCKNCDFWKRDGSDGVCKKNAPRPKLVQSLANAAYSIVEPRKNADDWCGEFIPLKD